MIPAFMKQIAMVAPFTGQDRKSPPQSRRKFAGETVQKRSNKLALVLFKDHLEMELIGLLRERSLPVGDQFEIILLVRG